MSDRRAFSRALEDGQSEQQGLTVSVRAVVAPIYPFLALVTLAGGAP